MKKIKFNTVTDLLLILLFLGGCFILLRPFSPQQVEGAFFGVKFIDENGLRYLLAGDQFGCVPIEDLPLDISCRTTFEGQSLAYFFGLFVLLTLGFVD